MKEKNVIILNNQNATRFIAEMKKNSDDYKVLSKEELLALIDKYRDDREKLNQELIMHHVRMVFNMAKNYAKTTDDFDDLIGRGFLGLSEAAAKFDIDAGIVFSTYAYFWIKKRLLEDFYKDHTKINNSAISLSAQLSSDTDDKNTLENYVNTMIDDTVVSSNTLSNDVVDSILKNETYSMLSKMLMDISNNEQTTELDKKIIADSFMADKKKSVRQIAEEANVEIKDVNKHKGLLLKKMREYMSKNYGIESYDDLLS